MEYLTNIKVKLKGQNIHSNKLIEGVLQSLASIQRDFVYVDWKHYSRKRSSWLERPFHFEFYHQLRLNFKDKLKNYKIQAEIEKIGHFSGIGDKRPDLIFHIPGNYFKTSQLIHIEIKPVKPNDNAHLEEIIKDIEKLLEFKVKLSYDISVMVLFGLNHELSETILFIEGNDTQNTDLNKMRDKVINRIQNEKKEIFLLELDITILE